MKLLSSILFSIFLTVLILPGCIDPTDVGSALLDGDFVNSDFTDTITVTTSTIKGDSIVTHVPATGAGLSSYMLGMFKNPFFGKTKATFYGQVGLLRSSDGISFVKPDFEGMTLDSVVLVLGLEPSSYYGITKNEDFNVKVSVLDEIIDVSDIQYSNAEYAIANDNDWKLSSGNTFTVKTTTDSINDYSLGVQTGLRFSHVRFVLPKFFGQRFLAVDSLTYENDSTFLEFFAGFKIEPTSVNKGMLALQMLGNKSNPAGALYFYLSQDGAFNTTRQYRFPFSPQRVRTVTFEHDYTTATAKDYIGDPTANDIFCVQGLQGLTGKVDFPFITENEGLIVNKAELEISIMPVPQTDYDILPPAEQKADGLIYPEIEQIIISTLNEDGNLILIKDVTFGLSAGNLSTSFGGTIIKGIDGKPDTYKINLSTHIQDMIDGLESSTIYITPYIRANNPHQVALYGSAHTEYPVKLNLFYTEK